jgi:steroid 5-alpha reductase family enzyme
MTYLIRYVSGVELLEEAMSKRPGWEEYAEKTPPFIPRLANLLNGSPEKKHTAEQQGEVSS